jgi:ribosomal protein RSM22 (predicted rRNA methylase)
VLAEPEVGKVEVTAKLCTPGGLVVAKIPRRAKADYARSRRWHWGDAVMETQKLSAGRPGERRDP